MISMKKTEAEKREKNRVLQFRLSKQDYILLKQKAALYTDGNLSQWIRAAIHQFKPKLEDLEITTCLSRPRS